MKSFQLDSGLPDRTNYGGGCLLCLVCWIIAILFLFLCPPVGWVGTVVFAVLGLILLLFSGLTR